MAAFISEWGATASLILAGWGALISTILAIVKLAEVWRSRYQLDADFSSATWDQAGNHVHIHNLTARQVVITHWELFAARGGIFLHDKFPVASPEWIVGVITIPAYSSNQLSFVGDAHFSVSHKVLDGRRLYIKIWAAGKWTKTIRLLPYRHPMVEAVSRIWRTIRSLVRSSMKWKRRSPD